MRLVKSWHVILLFDIFDFYNSKFSEHHITELLMLGINKRIIIDNYIIIIRIPLTLLKQ